MNNMNKLASRLLAAAASFAVPAITLAQGLTGTTPFAGTARGGLIPAIITIVNIFLVLAGLVAAIFMVIGGVQYIISRGDEGEVEKAKNTILYAVIGLVVIGISAAIVNFVVATVGAA